VIRLRNPEFLGVKTSLAGKSTLNQGAVQIQIPGKGSFSFSTRPEPGYRMEAIAEGAVLMFVAGSERYDIQCSGPVLDGPGAWYLRVRDLTAPRPV
jgi:hypothetical protein